VSAFSPPLARAPDLLPRLARALEQREPESALREALAPLSLLPEAQAEIVSRALRLSARVSESSSQASRAELELALGVLVALGSRSAVAERA